MSNNVKSSDQQRAQIAASQAPLDYYAILVDAIKKTEQNSAQLRALVYERARFHLKREALFGYSSLGMADILRHINELELAIARIETTAVDQQQLSTYRPRESAPAAIPEANTGAQATPEAAPEPITTSQSLVEVLGPEPQPPIYGDFEPNVNLHYFGSHQGWDAVLRHVRAATRFVGFVLLGFLFIGLVLMGTALWYFPKNSAVTTSTQRTGVAGVSDGEEPTSGISEPAAPAREPTAPPIAAPPKLPYPVPTSFGIYALHNNTLTELEPLPINVPDPRVALSAEITKSDAFEMADAKPAFILFRRDLLNNAPQKVTLRVVARMVRETKVVDGKAKVTDVEGSWRIRNVTRELNVAPVPGQPEMIIARVDDNAPLDAGRYALVLNRVGYEFTIKGPPKSLDFCLEGFETANGTVFTQCRAP